jgi:hypothetical protein
MRHDADGHLLEVGARTRTVPPALRRAPQHRDRGCRFPDCPIRFGEGHHIRHWAGLVLDARTPMPGWLGEHLDVGYAIDVLHPMARGGTG